MSFKIDLKKLYQTIKNIRTDSLLLGGCSEKEIIKDSFKWLKCLYAIKENKYYFDPFDYPTVELINNIIKRLKMENIYNFNDLVYLHYNYLDTITVNLPDNKKEILDNLPIRKLKNYLFLANSYVYRGKVQAITYPQFLKEFLPDDLPFDIFDDSQNEEFMLFLELL